MPRVDYEAAWEELAERILTRDGWGTRVLITEMAHLRVKHKLPEVSATAQDGTSPGLSALDAGAPKIQEDRDANGRQQQHRRVA